MTSVVPLPEIRYNQRDSKVGDSPAHFLVDRLYLGVAKVLQAEKKRHGNIGRNRHIDP